MPLSDSDIKGLLPKEKVYRKSVGNNLYVEVRPQTIKKDGSKGGGGKYFTWFYRYPLGTTKGHWYSIGTYGRDSEGRWSLKRARDERNRLESLRKQGQDPKFLKSEEKESHRGNNAYTFRKVADEWMGYQRSANRDTTVRDYNNKLNSQILPVFGNKLIKNITKEECFNFKKSHQERGKMAQADKLQRVLKQVFDYANEVLGMDIDNPAVESRFTKIKYKEKHHPALLDWVDVPPFLKDLSDNKCGGEWVTNNAVKLLLLTFVRVREILPSEWSEIDWKKKVWTIPAERMKGDGMGNDHLIPMSAPIIEVLEQLQSLNGNSRCIFETVRGRNTSHLGFDAPTRHIRNLGYGGKLVAHGFRRMAATHGQEKLGFSYDIINLQSGRGDKKSKVRKAYDAAQFMPERTDFMNQWGDLLVANGLKI